MYCQQIVKFCCYVMLSRGIVHLLPFIIRIYHGSRPLNVKLVSSVRMG